MQRSADKYSPAPLVDLPERLWPTRQLTEAPHWCSVDLRDGNQALANPMSIPQRLALFETLVRIGFKEIEVGFPSASQVDYDFIRMLIDQNRVPEDVSLQVLTPARGEHIRTSFDALDGAPRAVMHLYISTSPVQRDIVLGMGREQLIETACHGAEVVRKESAARPQTEWFFQYSPESFSATELDVALDICRNVLNIWQPTSDKPAVINLPATVELSTPNVYADQIEYMARALMAEHHVTVSVHTHNDRGCAIAAAELAMLAGARRVEGTLFGNGERTGNVDLVTLALNLHTQGVDPGLDFSQIDEVIHVVEECTELPVHPRHPYAGSLVYTAYSGSHQDAIRKGMQAQQGQSQWSVPYLPIDPADVGRSYESLVQVNSQSGKGGIAFVLEHEFGLRLPRALAIDFSRRVQQEVDESGRMLDGQRLYELFVDRYCEDSPIELLGYEERSGRGDYVLSLALRDGDVEWECTSKGSGPIEALMGALAENYGFAFEVTDYNEHTLGYGSAARAVAYIEVEAAGGARAFGVAVDTNVTIASLKAALRGVNRWRLATDAATRQDVDHGATVPDAAPG